MSEEKKTKKCSKKLKIAIEITIILLSVAGLILSIIFLLS